MSFSNWSGRNINSRIQTATNTSRFIHSGNDYRPSSPWQKCSDCPKLTYKSFRIDPDYSATGVLPRAARASVAVGNGRHGLHSISELLQDPILRSEFGWNFVL